MDLEIAILKTFTRALPPVRGSGVIGNLVRNWVARRKRALQQVNVFDFSMLLDPSECVDAGLLSYPQLYDRQELSFLTAHLKEGDVFLDVGANIGFYSLMMSRVVGTSGTVIAIEADPYNFARLSDHASMNSLTNVRCVNDGVSDKEETLRLAVDRNGNRGGNSFLRQSDTMVEVRCQTLLSILERKKISRIDGMKIDIEGFEFKVLSHFFSTAPKSLWPRVLVIENNPEFNKTSGNAVGLLSSVGYQTKAVSDINVLLIHPGIPVSQSHGAQVGNL